MGVWLDYVSTGPIAAEVKARVEADAAALNRSRRWWCEGMNLFDQPNRQGMLTGSTKLFLGAYDTRDGQYVDVNAYDDSFMAARDAKFIVEQLARWSGEHGIEWMLQCAGADVGRIARGRPNEELNRFIDSLFETASWMRQHGEAPATDEEKDEDEERRAARIDAKYASRWD